MQKYKFIFTILLISILSGFVQAQDEEYNPAPGSKCGTFQTSRFQPDPKKRNDRILNSRPALQKQEVSASGLFLIHFDTTGHNAVPMNDDDKNGNSDFVDSALIFIDYVYDVEVNQMHYLKPKTDNGVGSSDAYDIYLVNIGDGGDQGEGLYGYTDAEDEYSSTFNRPKFTSYIVIDNDFSQRDSTNQNGKKYRTFNDTGYTALKITLAHEYHHAVQFAYGQDYTSPSLNEMTSTWMEIRLVPYTKDYLQYVRSLFREPRSWPFGNGIAETGYRYSIFGEYLHTNFGDSVLLRMWERIALGVQGYKALDSALIDKNTSLAEEWCKQLEWFYFTGKRAKENQYFKMASQFPLVTLYKDEEFNEPSFTHSGGLLAYEFRFLRVRYDYPDFNTTSDTADILITDTDTESAVKQGTREMPYTVAVSSTPLTDSREFGKNKKYYYQLLTPQSNICDALFYSGGDITKLIGYAYPNPFVKTQDQDMFFPAPDGATINSKVEFYILNSSMEKVFESSTMVVGLDNQQNRVIIFSKELMNFSTGVYIFHSKYGNNECSGKFAIIQ
jgi:hypothetical protein